MPETELVTVWDGAHHNADEDLLCCPRLLKCASVPVQGRTVFVARESRALDQVERALHREPGTITELEARTGLSHGSVQTAIYKLNQVGVVVAQGSRQVRNLGRYAIIYGLVLYEEQPEVPHEG